MRNHNDRTPTRPGRRLITPEDGTAPFYATLGFADEPTDEGALVNKAMLDEFLSASGVTAGTATALLLSQPDFQLEDGASVRAKLHTNISGGVTLNVSSTGNRPIITAGGSAVIALLAGAWVHLLYSDALMSYVLQSGAIGGAIDCGWFTDPTEEGVAMHNATLSAHSYMVLDGNAEGVTEDGSLQDHMSNPNAHPNIIVDGNT